MNRRLGCWAGCLQLGVPTLFACVAFHGDLEMKTRFWGVLLFWGYGAIDEDSCSSVVFEVVVCLKILSREIIFISRVLS